MKKSYINKSDPKNPIAVIIVDGVEYEHSLAFVDPKHHERHIEILHQQCNKIHHRAAVKSLAEVEESENPKAVIAEKFQQLDKLKSDCNDFYTHFPELGEIVVPTAIR